MCPDLKEIERRLASMISIKFTEVIGLIENVKKRFEQRHKDEEDASEGSVLEENGVREGPKREKKNDSNESESNQSDNEEYGGPRATSTEAMDDILRGFSDGLTSCQFVNSQSYPQKGPSSAPTQQQIPAHTASTTLASQAPTAPGAVKFLRSATKDQLPIRQPPALSLRDIQQKIASAVAKSAAAQVVPTTPALPSAKKRKATAVSVDNTQTVTPQPKKRKAAKSVPGLFASKYSASGDNAFKMEHREVRGLPSP